MFYDYRCEKCNYIEKDVQHGPYSKIQIYCPVCNTILIKCLPNSFIFGGKDLVGKIRGKKK